MVPIQTGASRLCRGGWRDGAARSQCERDHRLLALIVGQIFHERALPPASAASRCGVQYARARSPKAAAHAAWRAGSCAWSGSSSSSVATRVTSRPRTRSSPWEPQEPLRDDLVRDHGRRRRSARDQLLGRGLVAARLDAGDDLHHVVDRGDELVVVEVNAPLSVPLAAVALASQVSAPWSSREPDLDRGEVGCRSCARRCRCTCPARCGRTPRRSRRRRLCAASSSEMSSCSRRNSIRNSAPVCALSSSITDAIGPPNTVAAVLAVDLVLVRRAEVVRGLVEDRDSRPGSAIVRRRRRGWRRRAGSRPACVEKVVDTTGAGDLFAAGFLSAQVEGRSLADSLTVGAVCAAEVISHYGPRPEADLKALVKARLG